MSQVVSLSFHRFDARLAQIWAFAQMGLSRAAMAKTPDIGFWKLCGSGTGEGFTPRPNTSVYAILATWPNFDIAQQRVTSAPVFERYKAQSSEVWHVFLSTQSVRGEWSGQSPFDQNPKNDDQRPLAALTRATIRPRTFARFWGRVPNISKVIGTDQNVLFKIGIGEVPLLHQITFSVWPDAQTMSNFARKGPHAEAIKAVRAEDWFSEELYARFAVVGELGSWGGTSPLKHFNTRLDAA